MAEAAAVEGNGTTEATTAKKTRKPRSDTGKARKTRTMKPDALMLQMNNISVESFTDEQLGAFKELCALRGSAAQAEAEKRIAALTKVMGG